MVSTVVTVLAAWFGLNVAFVAIRLYFGADQASAVEDEFGRYPRIVN